MEATTVDITQEIGRNSKWWVISSDKINVKWAKSIVKTISTSSLFFIFQIIWLNKIQVINQKIIHQKSIDKNFQTQEKIVIESKLHQAKIIHNITINKATEVQSLNKLSHSKRIVNLLGAQSDLKIDKTATGSVAEIKVQKSKQTKNGTSIQTKGKIK